MLTVDADWTGLSRYLNAITRRQLPFATARATTKLAQEAQAAVRAGLPRHFTIRSAWVPRGIRIQRAEKRDWPAVQAIVGSIDWFMELQETGATRTPQGSRQHLPVPKAVRPTKETRVPRSKWPSALLRKGGRRRAFVGRIRGGLAAGQLAVLRRTSESSYPLEVLYLLETRTRGERRLKLESTVQDVVARRHEAVFLEALERALQPRAAGVVPKASS